MMMINDDYFSGNRLFIIETHGDLEGLLEKMILYELCLNNWNRIKMKYKFSLNEGFFIIRDLNLIDLFRDSIIINSVGLYASNCSCLLIRSNLFSIMA